MKHVQEGGCRQATILEVILKTILSGFFAGFIFLVGLSYVIISNAYANQDSLEWTHSTKTLTKSENQNRQKVCRIGRSLPSMGTLIAINAVVPCRKVINYLPLQSRLDEIEKKMSLYQSSSWIRKINDQAKLSNDTRQVLTDRDLTQVMIAALDVGQKTEGAFDITIFPVLKEIQESFHLNHRPPDEKKLASLKSLVDFHQVKIQKNTIVLSKRGMALTLDGIAKGYAVDQVAQLLEGQGVQNYLINFSGNMRWRGRKETGNLWNIEILNPKTKKLMRLAQSEEGAVASSGVQVNFYSKDQAWHHIIDPRNLHPSQLWLLTSVSMASSVKKIPSHSLGNPSNNTHPSAMLCDALSTAAFVMGKSQIQSIFKAHFPQFQVWAIDKKGSYFKEP